MTADLRLGDALDVMRTLDDGAARTIITSPPYWGLRDYGVDGQLGLEATPEEYVDRLVTIFREARRVLTDDGTLWLNLGDSYVASAPGNGVHGVGRTSGLHGINGISGRYRETLAGGHGAKRSTTGIGLRPKNLIGVPWRVAFALQVDGWYLRSDIIWSKPNPMPESVRDRPTKAHEYVFLMSKSERYYYDAEAIREQALVGDHENRTVFDNVPPPPPGQPAHTGLRRSGNKRRKYGGARARPGSHLGASVPWEGETRNKRSVWTVATHPFPEAHFATFPPELIRPCVQAGSEPGDLILDPFAGSGTTGLVALQHGRRFVGIELNPEYVAMAEKRLEPLLAQPRLLEAPT